MTTEKEISPSNRWVRGLLPWLIAAGALVVYLVTINRWVSFTNLLHVGKLSGWVWQPDLAEPLYWLVTYPLHWVPVKSIPLALNLFSVLFAVLTLALLARSVALLPHDRTLEQRQRENGEHSFLSISAAWLPPVFAALICGLQLTFWESATSGSSEMLNLLVFAYVIRCLLEFRVDESESWLTRAALVFGLGMANNWAMIGFFPLFLAALVWIKGLSFFNLRFLSVMFVCGLAGLSLYLLMPLLQSRADIMPIPFWQGLKSYLGNQQGVLAMFYKTGRPTIALLALTSLVPIFIIGIKWASYFGDTSKIGIALATFMFHFSHAILLLACVWVAMDPPFSPRNIGFGQPFLTFYYLSALSAGYFAGYFLLVFGAKAVRSRRIPGYLKLLNSTITLCVWLLLFLAPAVLIARSLPQIRATNGPMFKQIASLMTESLPSKGAIVLGDELPRLLLAQADLAQKGKDHDYIFVDSGTFNNHLVLEYPDYHRFLRKHHGARWLGDPPKERNKLIAPLTMVPLFSALEQSNTLFYLHPSFGFYFERFYTEPHGLVFKLVPFVSTNLFPPSLSNELITENETFWTKAEAEAIKPLLPALRQSGTRPKPNLMDSFAAKLRLKIEPNRDASLIARFYSRALDYWAVQLQKRGDLERAAARFEQALELNPANVAAEVSLQCNKNLRANKPAAVPLSKSVTESFGPYRTWNTVITEYGPFDEPNFCYEQGQVFVQGKLFRQAIHQFTRVTELDRSNLPVRLWLAQLYIMFNRPADAVQLITEIRQNENLFRVDRTNVTELMFAEGSAHLANKDPDDAQIAVKKALDKFETDKELLPHLLETASQMYLNFGYFSNALPIINRQLQLAPENPRALVNKGYVCLQLQAYDQAIPPLTRVLELQTNNYSALLNRAIAYLRANQLDSARQDYQTLQKAAPSAYPVYYGLAEIAYQQKDTNAAIQNYELYLANGSPNADEIKFVTQRLAELKQR